MVVVSLAGNGHTLVLIHSLWMGDLGSLAGGFVRWCVAEEEEDDDDDSGQSPVERKT